MKMRLLRVSAVLFVVAMVLTASFGADAHPRIRFGEPVVAIASCDGSDRSLGIESSGSACYEPTATVDPKGRIFVTNGFGNELAVSTNGGRSFSARLSPPPPPGDEFLLGDAIVQIDRRGRLVFSNIYASGIQLAISSTGGRSWDVNTVVGLDPVTLAPAPDRQWIAFGPRNEIYVFWRTGSLYWTATSTDGGRTFGIPEPFLPGQNIFSTGQPIVDTHGHVYVPVIIGGVGIAATIGVAVSATGASTTSFNLRTVAQVPSADFFPAVGIDRVGRVAVAWHNNAGGASATNMSESFDHGRSWTAPHRWGPLNTTAGPWVTVRDGRIDVLSFEVLTPGQQGRAVLARGSRPAGPDQVVAVAPPVYMKSGSRSEGNTDYANFALTPDGRVVAVWCDSSVYVAVEKSR